MLYVVIGPPAGGKSTWVREHAQPGDITIDYDALANTLTPQAKDSHEHTAAVKKVTKAARKAAIDTALTITGINVYIIHSTPSADLLTKYQRAGAEIVTIDPGMDIVLARAKQERPWWMQGAIKRWYQNKGEDMTSNPNRGGHRWTQVKTDFKTKCEARQLPCHLCDQPIDYTAPSQQADAFEADHDKPVATHPDLAYQMGNLKPSHSSCNRSRGSKPIPQGEWIAADW